MVAQLRVAWRGVGQALGVAGGAHGGRKEVWGGDELMRQGWGRCRTVQCGVRGGQQGRAGGEQRLVGMGGGMPKISNPGGENVCMWEHLCMTLYECGGMAGWRGFGRRR